MAFNVNGYNAYNPYRYNTGPIRPMAMPAVSFGHMVAPTDSFNPTNPALNTTSYQAFTATPYYTGMAYPNLASQPTQPFLSTLAPSLPGINRFQPAYNNPYTALNTRPAYNPFPGNAFPQYATTPTIIYANPPGPSQQEQRKKSWVKFMMNTGSTLAGLSLAAYFGMKILPKAIVGEMGTQVKNNLLSNNSKKLLLDEKLQNLLKSPDTPKSIKELLRKDPKTLNRWQLAKREKVLLESCESSEVAAKFLQDSLTQAVSGDFGNQLLDKMQAEKHLKERLSNITGDKVFMEEMKKNVVDNFVTPLSDTYLKNEKNLKEVTDKLAATVLQSIRDKGGLLGRWV